MHKQLHNERTYIAIILTAESRTSGLEEATVVQIEEIGCFWTEGCRTWDLRDGGQREGHDAAGVDDRQACSTLWWSYMIRKVVHHAANKPCWTLLVNNVQFTSNIESTCCSIGLTRFYRM